MSPEELRPLLSASMSAMDQEGMPGEMARGVSRLFAQVMELKDRLRDAERERDCLVRGSLFYDAEMCAWRVGNPRIFESQQAQRLYAVREYLRGTVVPPGPTD